MRQQDEYMIEHILKRAQAVQEDKNPMHHNLVSDQLDYSVHQRILDFGFVGAIKQGV